MVNMPYAEDAIKLYKETPGIGLGVHLNITAVNPLSDDVKALVDNNVFRYRSYYENKSNAVNCSKVYAFRIVTRPTKDISK